MSISTALATTLVHTDAVAKALRDVARGTSPSGSQPPLADILREAIARSPSACSNLTYSLSNLALCHPDNTVQWIDANGEAQHADASPVLDVLLHNSADDQPVWKAVRAHDVRQVAMAHYVSHSASACDGVAPYVFRLHYFCHAGATAAASLWSMRHARRDDDMPWRTTTSSNRQISSQPAAGEPRCELDGLVELPSLCASPPFADTQPLVRFEALLSTVYTQKRVHGYTTTGGTADKALTYGELSAAGMLTMIDALGHASATPNDDADASTDAPDASWSRMRASLGPEHIFVDVGSGVGKLVLALPLLTNVARAVGIEVEPVRHQRAQDALRDATRRGLLTAEEGERIVLSEEDATLDGALPAATSLVYLSNLCFGEALSRAITRQLRRLPRLQCVAALRELDGSDATAHVDDEASCRLTWVRSLRVATTWDEHSRLHIYCCRRG